MEYWQLKQRQSLPLEAKIIHSLNVIKQAYEYFEGAMYVSFSGGKDSTVLTHLVREVSGYKDVPLLFCDTGLEYPEIRLFVKTFENVITRRPETSFQDVLKNEGYPIISKKVSRMLHDLQNPSDTNENSRRLYLTGEKCDGNITKYFKLPNKYVNLINAPFKISNKCCDIMKKIPFHKYEKETGRRPFIGTMADDSKQRESSYLKTECTTFNTKGKSAPLSIWTEQDVLQYIKQNSLPISKIYGDVVCAEPIGDEGYLQQNMFNDGKLITTGEKRTGCMFCMYGVHLEKGENRFQRMKRTHHKQYNYCINELGVGEALDCIGVKY